MQVYKTFCRVAYKNLPSLSIYFIMYAVMAVLLCTNSQKSLESNFQSTQLTICIQDESNSDASQALSHYLGSIHHIVTLENDPQVLQDQLYYRTVDCILTIPDDFETRLLAMETDALIENAKIPGSSTGYFVDAQIQQYLSGIQTYIASGLSLEEAVDHMKADVNSLDNVNVVQLSTDATAQDQGTFRFYQYLPYVMILVLLCGLAPVILVFQKPLLRSRMDCSSLPGSRKTLETMMGIGTYSLFIWICFLVLGFLLCGSSMFTGHGLLALLNSFVFLLFTLGLTLLVTNFHLDNNSLNLLANLTGLGMAFTTGVFVPQSMLSPKLLSFSRWLPSYWYIRANNMLGGFSDTTFTSKDYWSCIGIELAFVVTMYALAFAFSKVRRQK